MTTMFYNELAAVPSLHVGFAFAVGIAIAASSSNRLVKVLAHLWGPTVALAVVATGNHFVFDIAAGMVAAAPGYGLASGLPRRRPPIRLPVPPRPRGRRRDRLLAPSRRAGLGRRGGAPLSSPGAERLRRLVKEVRVPAGCAARAPSSARRRK